MPTNRSYRSSRPTLEKDQLRQHIYEVLQQWSQLRETTVLDYLCLVEFALQHKSTESHPVHTVICAALKELEKKNSDAAQVLRLRFIGGMNLQKVGEKLSSSIATVSRRQRDGLNELVNILHRQEMRVRKNQQAALLARLGPKPYSRLFGVEQHISAIIQLLSAERHPRLIAIEGIGGIGKTALADALMRRAIEHGMFDCYGWTSIQPRQLGPGGKILTISPKPVQTADEVLLALVTQLNPDAPLPPPDRVIPFLKEQLRRAAHLIVIDNLETLQDRDALLPQLEKLVDPSIFVLTARESLFDVDQVYPYRIGQLEAVDALKLIRYEAAANNLPLVAASSDAQLMPIIDTVGGNPLAIKLVVGQLHLFPLQVVVDALAHAQGTSIENLYTFIYRRAWDSLDEITQSVFLATLLLPIEGADFEFLRTTTNAETPDLLNALNTLVVLNLVDRHHYDDLNKSRYSIHSLTHTFLTTDILDKWK
ncbi:MAG: NB-ARC domain-containing protein [Caldilineaceae bacterium]